jgi:hypothetical protein
MSATIRKSVIGLVLLAVVSAAGAVVLTSTAEVRASKASRRLEGTWLVDVTITNCDTGDALRHFPALLTFAQGGTLTETTSGFPPAARTAGHGFWDVTPGGGYTASSSAFLFAPDGTFTGTQTLVQTIEIGSDPNTFTSTATNTIVNPAGVTVATGCATAVAHRLG